MNVLRTLCLLALATPAAGFTSSAQAQDGGYGWGGGWPYNFQSGIYGRTNAYSLPYFALHPPVYYSYAVPRPYGYSPFALPPGVEPAEMLVVPAAKPIENPHFKPKDTEAKPEAKKTSDKSTYLPRAIVNPYFREPVEGRLARLPAR